MNDKLNIEQLTLKQLLSILTIKQTIAILSSIVLLLGGSFSLGLNFEKTSHISKSQELESQLHDLNTKVQNRDAHIQFLRAKEKFLELTSVILFNSSMLDYDLWKDKHWYSRFTLSVDEFEKRLEDYYIYVEEITDMRGKEKPIAYMHLPRAGPTTLEFKADVTNWVVIPVPNDIRLRVLNRGQLR